MRRWLLATLILGLLSFAVSGCGEPGYDYYGYPGYGYAPYSYGYFGRSYYEPDFRYHHDWVVAVIAKRDDCTRRETRN